MQMMLILVLGHVLALTEPVDKGLQVLLKYCTSTARAAGIITFVSIFVAFFNWGLALVLGAIFARKAGAYATANKFPLNYPLIGAAGYAGLMVWHGGISGSAPLKVAEPGHKFEAEIGLIPFSETIFSPMNLVCMGLLLFVVPLAMYWMGTRSRSTIPNVEPLKQNKETSTVLKGAEKLDDSSLLATLVGGGMLCLAIYKVIIRPELINGLRFITPNYIIFILFALGILLHGSLKQFGAIVF